MSDNLDQRLTKLHTTVGQQLDALLDLDTGLGEVLTATPHRRLGPDLDRVLDLDAGLRAIVAPTEPDTRPGTPPRPETPVSEVARLLVSCDTPTRLALRHHQAFDVIAVAFAVARVRLTTATVQRHLDRGNRVTGIFALTLDFRHDIDRVYARARALDRVNARALVPALKFVDDRVYDLNDGFARALTNVHRLTHDRDLERARALALDLNRQLALALDSVLDHVCAVVRARTLDLDLPRALDLDRALGVDLGRAPELAIALDLDLALARHDFTNADLHDVDLTRVRLDRLRWSEQTTRWPSAQWRERALRDSVEVEPGVYEIRPGTAPVSDDVLAP